MSISKSRGRTVNGCPPYQRDTRIMMRVASPEKSDQCFFLSVPILPGGSPVWLMSDTMR